MPRAKKFVLAVYLFCALPVCLATLVLLPPGLAPDEPAHLARAEGLLHGAVLAVRKTNIDPFTGKPELIVGIKVERDLQAVTHAPDQVTLADMAKLQAVPPDRGKFFDQIPNTARYFPIAYIPGTIGLAIGLALHLSPYLIFLLGRAGMMFAFLLLGGLALWITAYGEVLLLAILISPMTLFLAGSFNEDAVIAAMTCLACALLTHPIPWRRYGALALLAGVMSAKLLYAPLLAAAAFPLNRPGIWQRLRETGIAYLPVLLWAGIATAFVVVPFGVPPYHPGPLYLGDRSIWLDHTDPAMGLRIMLHPPTRLFLAFYETNKYYMRFFLRQFLEPIPVGALAATPPTPYHWAWGIAYVSALFGLIFNPRPERAAPKIALLNFAGITALIVLTYWLLLIGLYMDWNFAGGGLLIFSFVGRYFLPFLPFFVLAIPAWRGKFLLPIWLPALPVLCVGIFDLGYLPVKLVTVYYLH
jgi:hypothetical protein